MQLEYLDNRHVNVLKSIENKIKIIKNMLLFYVEYTCHVNYLIEIIYSIKKKFFLNN